VTLHDLANHNVSKENAVSIIWVEEYSYALKIEAEHLSETLDSSTLKKSMARAFEI
jgi:hypothetical protein